MTEIGTRPRLCLPRYVRGIETKTTGRSGTSRSTGPMVCANAEQRLEIASVLPIDESIAEVGARLERSPTPLPLIDGLLAATAKVYGLTLVTRNVADISRTGVCAAQSVFPVSCGTSAQRDSELMADLAKDKVIFVRQASMGGHRSKFTPDRFRRDGRSCPASRRPSDTASHPAA